MPSGIGTKGSKRAGEERQSTPAEKKKEKKKLKDNYESAKNCKQEKTPVEQATATATETKTDDLERGRSDPKLAREHQLGPSLVMGEACDFERCKHVPPTYLQIKSPKPKELKNNSRRILVAFSILKITVLAIFDSFGSCADRPPNVSKYVTLGAVIPIPLALKHKS